WWRREVVEMRHGKGERGELSSHVLAHVDTESAAGLPAASRVYLTRQLACVFLASRICYNCFRTAEGKYLRRHCAESSRSPKDQCDTTVKFGRFHLYREVRQRRGFDRGPPAESRHFPDQAAAGNIHTHQPKSWIGFSNSESQSSCRVLNKIDI